MGGFNLDAAEWRIPAAKMKMRQEHVVPLSRQCLNILRELHPLTGQGRYLFPGLRSVDRPMSENTVNGALRRLASAIRSGLATTVRNTCLNVAK